MSDPLTLLANQNSQKQQTNNALLNEMEDLDNNVIPHNETTNKDDNKNDQNGPSKRHYRSISHNVTNFSPSKVFNSAYQTFAGAYRKQNTPNQNITINNGSNTNGTKSGTLTINNSNHLSHSLNSYIPNGSHSPQPITADEDGDIANLSIFAMDHRTTHNFDDMMDEKYFNHETHTLDRNKKVNKDRLMIDEVSNRGQLHNETVMIRVQCYFVQYNVDTKQDVVILGELCVTNYLLFFEPNNPADVPGGMEHLVIPIHSIGKVSDNQGKYRRDTTSFELEITTRDYRVLRIRFGSADRVSSYSHPPEKIQQMLKLLAFPQKIQQMFAFSHSHGHPLSKLLKTQSDEKLKYEKLRKLKKQDMIKQEVKRRKQLAKQHRKSTVTTSSANNNNNRLGKPAIRKRKKSKSRRKARKSTIKKNEPPPQTVSLTSPSRDSSEEPPDSSKTQSSTTNETNHNNDDGTIEKSENSNNTLQVNNSNNKDNESTMSITPSPEPSDNDVLQEQNESDEDDSEAETDTSSTAPSLRSQGSIDIHNITLEMLDEKEKLFLKNELWGFHTYNIQKEFERMGIFMDDTNNFNNSQQNPTSPVGNNNNNNNNFNNLASLATPHHTFSDPANININENYVPNGLSNNNSNSSNDPKISLLNNNSNGHNNNNINNPNNQRPKLPIYDAPTPSTVGNNSNNNNSNGYRAPMGPISNHIGPNIGVRASHMGFNPNPNHRDINAAVDTALNHGRSQTQADLQSLKRYRGQLADTRMGDTNYPQYRFTKANAYYEICETYSTLLVVPMAITDWELQQVAKFRRLGRIPVLTWKSRNNNVAMFRCSQPKVGLGNTRSRFDEHLLKCIIEANNTITDSKLYIMDARPRLNASLNKMKGAGFENVNHYKNVILEFLNVHNIHAMRKSRKALAQIIHQPRHKDKEWLSVLDSTEWMTHIREILKGSLAIINVITLKECNVLCHCSDGWDRTSQLCGLAQLCLDSYYRTIKGFLILIDKEWLSFGHQFGKRTGHGKDDSIEDDERSPVFEQFIECTYHLTQQFPTSFEFNDIFLIEILDHLYDCRFGTFLFDCHKQRIENKLYEQTLSLWTYLQNCKHRSSFFNTFYVPTQEVLYPRFSSKVLKFWNKHYLRNCPQHILSPEPMYNENNDIEQQFLKMKMEVEQLRNQIKVMKQKSSRIVEEDELD